MVIRAPRLSLSHGVLVTTLMYLILASSFSRALELPHQFQAQTPALASQVNENFSTLATEATSADARITALETQVTNLLNLVQTLQTEKDALEARIVSLETDPAINQFGALSNQVQSIQTTSNNLESRMTSIESNTVLALDGLLVRSSTTDPNTGATYPLALFEGINVQITNGDTVGINTANGLGNLQIGYSNTNNFFNTPLICSIAVYTTLSTCQNNGGYWSRNHKTGSHNLLVGGGQSYSGVANIMGGENNASNSNSGIVLGNTNSVQNQYSGVLGGRNNQTRGEYSMIVGGASNLVSVSTDAAVITGGSANINNGSGSVISGGASRSSSTINSWVGGGLTQNN